MTGPQDMEPGSARPQASGAQLLSLRARRWIIGCAALLVLAGVIVAQAPRQARPALAQDATNTPSQTPSQTPSMTPTTSGTATATSTPFGTPTATWTPFVFGTPTVVPTPTRPRRIITEISSPKSGDAVAGYAPIEGSALKTSFRSYELHISPAGADQWAWLVSSYDIIAEGTLHFLDTTRFPDGFYDIRLRSVDDGGNYEDFFLRGVEIRNAFPPTPTPKFNAEGTLIPPPPISPLGPPTATPRPRILANIPETGQGIFAPEVGEQVAGWLDIVGTANGSRLNPFERYEIAISAAGMDNWSWLYTSDEQLWVSVLYTLDTRRFPDGIYDLRLRTVFRDGNFEEFIVRYLQIANAGSEAAVDLTRNGIYKPRSYKAVGGIVDFVGTAVDASFLRWELAWSPAGAEEWAFLVSGERQRVNATLARLDLSKLAGATVDFRLRVVRQDHNYDEYFAREVHVLPPTPLPPTPFSPLGTPTPTPLG